MPDAAPGLPPATTRRARVQALFEIVLCSSIPTQLLIATAMAVAGLAPLGDDGELSLPFVATVSLADTALLVVLMIGFTLARGERLRDLWLGDRPVAGEGVIGLLHVPVVFGLVVLAVLAVRASAPGLENLDANPFQQLAATPRDAVVLGAVGVLAGGVREELQRAFLLRRAGVLLGARWLWVGVAALAIGFGAGHYVQGWSAAVATGVLGAFWAIIYLRRGSIVAPVVSHAVFNSLQIAALATLA